MLSCQHSSSPHLITNSPPEFSSLSQTQDTLDVVFCALVAYAYWEDLGKGHCHFRCGVNLQDWLLDTLRQLDVGFDLFGACCPFRWGRRQLHGWSPWIGLLKKSNAFCYCFVEQRE